MYRYSKLLRVLLVVVLTLTLAGCWDSQDINKRDIILMIYVDYEDGEYRLLGEIATTNQLGQSAGDKPEKNVISKFDVKAKSLVETREMLERETTFEIFVAANRTVIFGDGLAKKGIEEYVNRLLADIGYRQRVNVVTTATSPDKFMKLEPKNAASLGFAVEDIVENLRNNRTIIDTDLGQLTEQMLDKKNTFLLPQFDKYNDTVALSGYSVFHENRKVGFIPVEESRGLVTLLGREPSPRYSVDVDDCRYVVRALYKDRKIKPVLKNDGLEFNITYKYYAEIDTLSDIQRFITDKDIKEIDSKLRQIIKDEAQKTIDKAQQEYGLDYLQFDHYFRRYYPSQYRKIDDWSEVFSSAKINVDVEIHELIPPPPLFQ